MTWGLEKEIDEISESLSAKMEGSAQKKKKNKKKKLYWWEYVNRSQLEEFPMSQVE